LAGLQKVKKIIAMTFWVSRADFFCFPLNDRRFPDNDDNDEDARNKLSEGYGSD
jgi:hypothetical protein